MTFASTRRKWATVLDCLSGEKFPDYEAANVARPQTDGAKRSQEMKRWTVKLVAAARMAGETAEHALDMAATAAGVNPTTVRTWISDGERQGWVCFTAPLVGLYQRPNKFKDEVRDNNNAQ